MNKNGSNALWSGMSPEQLKTLDKWLFEDRLSYATAWPQARAELGFKGSVSSLKRYCLRRKRERKLEVFEQLRNDVAAIAKGPMDAEALRGVSMKLLAIYLFQQMREAPENVKEWGGVARLILREDHAGLMREWSRDGLQLRQEALMFARERFEFNMVDSALKALPQLLALAAAKKNLLPYEEKEHRNEVRQAMFRATQEEAGGENESEGWRVENGRAGLGCG